MDNRPGCSCRVFGFSVFDVFAAWIGGEFREVIRSFGRPSNPPVSVNNVLPKTQCYLLLSEIFLNFCEVLPIVAKSVWDDFFGGYF